jgi:exopolysaccharide biosynthesis polyprenyl glycosylphosphotransferase
MGAIINITRTSSCAVSAIAKPSQSAIGTNSGVNENAFLTDPEDGTRCTRAVDRFTRHLDLNTTAGDGPAYAYGFDASQFLTAGRRVFDVAVSGIFLLLTFPLMMITAVLVRFDSPGPVIYRQLRSGLHGKPYTIFKFRSMFVDAEADIGPTWAQPRDPRATRVGSFIRSMRIDELPQFINVLRGEMSVIGPRPERPHFVEELTPVIPLYYQRLGVKPGITGWAQVNCPYGASVENAREKLVYDLYYVKNRDFLLDLQILVATVRVILFREGAR